MFGHVYKCITEASSNYYIIAISAASAIIGAYLNDEEQSHCTNLTMSVLSGFTGYLLASSARKEDKTYLYLRRDCNELAWKIQNQIEQFGPEMRESCREAANKVINRINTMSLESEKQASLLTIWMARKNVLAKLYEKTLENPVNMKFWLLNASAMFLLLQSETGLAAKKEDQQNLRKIKY